ncbi:MAG: hypothetical protein MZV64_69330 [Ignavibacteriales bacterium]|nr:hypothetical protein [Ignavibacteriales bacterium]
MKDLEIAKDTVAIGEPDLSPGEGDYSTSNLPEREKFNGIYSPLIKKDLLILKVH